MQEPKTLEEILEEILDDIFWLGFVMCVRGKLELSPKESIDEARQSIQQLIKQARADQLKKLWNATQHDIVPEGTPPRDMSEELHKMIKELEE